MKGSERKTLREETHEQAQTPGQRTCNECADGAANKSSQFGATDQSCVSTDTTGKDCSRLEADVSR